MSKHWKIGLDAHEIDGVIRDLQAYVSELDVKCELVREQIAQLLAVYAEVGFNGATVNDHHSPLPTTVTVESGGENVTLVVAQGEEAMFIEFGAGVHYNGGGVPYASLGADFPGYAMGSYGKGNGIKDYWHYMADGRWHTTHGTRMQSPFHNAFLEILPAVESIVRNVFQL